MVTPQKEAPKLAAVAPLGARRTHFEFAKIFYSVRIVFCLLALKKKNPKYFPLYSP